MADMNNIPDELQKIHEKIDKVIDDVNVKVNDVLKKVHDEIDELPGVKPKKSRKRWDNTFLGLVFLVFGFFWLGNNLDWFDLRVPFWPVILIIIGLYLLLESRDRD